MQGLENFNYDISGTNLRGRLVFLHGVMGAGQNWRRITTPLTDEFEILTYDQRGHGKSFHPPVEGDRGYRSEDYADDLKLILDELGWDQMELIGHSLGGRNALNFAVRFPDRVKKLVLVDIGLAVNMEAAKGIERLIDLVPTPFENKKAARQFFTGEYQKLIAHHPQPQVIAQFFYMNIEEKPDGTADWRPYRPGIIASLYQSRVRDRWQDFKSLQMPTLVVRGESSKDLTREEFEEMLKAQPQATGIEVAGAGHWVHSDQPERFIEVLRGFL